MAGVHNLMFSPRSGLFGGFHGSIRMMWYLLALMLVTKDENPQEDIENNILDNEVYVASSEIIESEKTKKPTDETQLGRDCDDGEGSNDCLIPGLQDDLALDCLKLACRSDYFALACVNKRFRSLIDSGYLYKLRRELGIVEQWVHIACSLMPWEAFDPIRQRWMRMPEIPCDECFSLADRESLAVGTELLVFGQEFTGFAIWMYSLPTRAWSRCKPMNTSRCLFGSSSLGEIGIVSGGCNKIGNVLKSAEMYNSETGDWELLPEMNVPRKLCSGFFMDGKFYVIGGLSSRRETLSCGEEYDLKTKTWKRIKCMSPRETTAMQSPPLVAVVNNQLFAADDSTNEVKEYDKTNNTWRVVRELPVRADSTNGWGLAFRGCGDKLMVIGACTSYNNRVVLVYSWRPEDGREAEWDVLSTRPVIGSFVHNCAIMGC